MESLFILKIKSNRNTIKLYKKDGDAMTLMNRPGRKIIKAKSTLGTNSKRRSEAAAFFISLKGINKKDKAIRINYDVGRKDDVTKIRGMMIVIPFIMVIVLAAGFWVAVNEFKKLNPPVYQTESTSDLPAVIVGETSAVLKENERLLTLVSLKYALPADYQVNLQEYNGVLCDAAIKTNLQKMIGDAKAQGCSLKVTQGYVDGEQQQALYLAKVAELIERLSQVKAEEEAKKLVPPQGKSENQTGLAVTITGENTPEDANFKDTEEFKWLSRNCVEYGFVLRYAANKEGVTQMSFDPHHFRYVGIENAKKMRTLDMCLEEYSSYIANQQQK